MRNKILFIAITIVSAAFIFFSGHLSYTQEEKDSVEKMSEEVEEWRASEEESPPPPAEAYIPPAEPAKPAEEGAVAVEETGEAQNAELTAAATEEALKEEPVMVEPGNVTVNFKSADIRTVLAYLSEVSAIDIVPSPDVKGVVDLKLTNKPWQTALDIIVRNYGFAYEREGDIIRVITVDKLKQEELATQAFSLNYGKAKDVVASIKDIVGDRGKVMYDERTNIVLVTDIPTNLYKMAQIIDRLDKKTDQVLIEARVIETVLGDDEKLGIDWSVKFSVSGAKRPTTIPFENFNVLGGKKQRAREFFPQVYTASSTSVTSSTTTGTTTSTTATDFPSEAGQYPGGFPFAERTDFTFGTLDFTEFKAVLEMIKSRSNTDIVSNPRIATLNNNEALINVGQTLNLPRYERNSSTGKMEITGYDAKDLGIILKVTPHINDRKEIVIDLAPEISDLLRYDTLDLASGVVAPVFSTRQAKTQIMINDGDTIFIGGLIKENNVDTKKKLPFFGDIFGDVPYLGLLFTKKEITKQKTELIFFITVYLMAPDKEIIGAPLPSKAYVPMYITTQEEDKPSAKKRPRQKRF